MKDKKIVGITGLYCSGKNHLAFLLEQRGFPVLDVDSLGHKAIETEKEQIISRFGSDILDFEGKIDRKRLGAKVFGRAVELAALEEILHPVINMEALNWINAQEKKVCFINAALLHRFSAIELLHSIIIVEAPFWVRLLRAKKRDRLSWGVLLKRFRSQKKFRSQYFNRNTDIFRVGNFGFSCFGKRSLQNRLENRIDNIFSQMGIIRV